MNDSNLTTILGSIAAILGPIILAALTYLGKKVHDLIVAKIDNAYLESVLCRLNDHVLSIVKELEQTVVNGLKEAAKDGILTDEEKAKVKNDALIILKAYIGAKGLKELAEVLGLGTDMLDKFLTTKIEAAVHDIKLAGEIASNPTLPKP